MKCIKCGEEIKKNDKYCPKCGEKTSINKEDILIKAYIGDGYEKIKEETFSIPAFLLGPLYMFYRKLYAYGALAVLSVLLVLNIDFYNEVIKIIGCLALYIIFGMLFNKIYMLEAKKRVNIIKNRNIESNEETLIKICKYEGRTTIIIPIIYVLSLILGIGLLLLFDYAYYIEPVSTFYYMTGDSEETYLDEDDYHEDYNSSSKIDNDDEEYEEYEESSSYNYSEGCKDDGETTTDCLYQEEMDEPVDEKDGYNKSILEENGE